MEIQITAKKWLWQFEYPDGSRTVNEMHVPVNKPVKFVMTSEDVLHDFFVPDMRVKRDIIPGRYTEVWFTPTVLGKHAVTCAEYCGKGHSDMHAKLIVDTPEKYDKWMATGGTEWKNHTPEDWGKINGSTRAARPATRSMEAKSKGPSWKGIWGKMVKLNDGTRCWWTRPMSANR